MRDEALKTSAYEAIFAENAAYVNQDCYFQWGGAEYISHKKYHSPDYPLKMKCCCSNSCTQEGLIIRLIHAGISLFQKEKEHQNKHSSCFFSWCQMTALKVQASAKGKISLLPTSFAFLASLIFFFSYAFA